MAQGTEFDVGALVTSGGPTAVLGVLLWAMFGVVKQTLERALADIAPALARIAESLARIEARLPQRKDRSP